MKRPTKSAASIVIILLLSFLGVSWFQVKREQRRAISFVSELRKIEPGVSNFHDLSQLSSQFGANREIVTSSPCDQRVCQVLFNFENRSLARLHLAPFTSFRGGIGLENGKVVDLAVHYAVEKGGEVSSGATVLEFPASPERDRFAVTKGDIAGGKPPFTIIRLSSDASPWQKAIAFDFNLNCLSRLGGCADAKVLSPSVWNMPHRE